MDFKGIMVSEKISKGCICDTIYTTFLKRRNYRDGDNFVVSKEVGGGGGDCGYKTVPRGIFVMGLF